MLFISVMWYLRVCQRFKSNRLMIYFHVSFQKTGFTLQKDLLHIRCYVQGARWSCKQSYVSIHSILVLTHGTIVMQKPEGSRKSNQDHMKTSTELIKSHYYCG